MDASSEESTNIAVAIDGDCATVSLARPDVRNAQTPEMWTAEQKHLGRVLIQCQSEVGWPHLGCQTWQGYGRPNPLPLLAAQSNTLVVKIRLKHVCSQYQRW